MLGFTRTSKLRELEKHLEEELDAADEIISCLLSDIIMLKSRNKRLWAHAREVHGTLSERVEKKSLALSAFASANKELRTEVARRGIEIEELQAELEKEHVGRPG